MESMSMYTVGNVYSLKAIERSKALNATTLKTIFGAGRVIVDTAAIVAAVMAAYAVRFAFYPLAASPPPQSMYIAMGLSVALAFYIINNWRNLHQPRRGASRIDEVFAVSGSLLLAQPIFFMLFFFYRDISLSRLTWVFFLAFSLGFVALARILLSTVERSLRAKGWGLKKVLVVGSGNGAELLVEKISRHPEMGLFLLGYLKNGGLDVLARHRVVNHGKISDLPAVLDTFAVDEVIVALPSTESEQVNSIISTCDEFKAECKLVPDFYELIRGPARTDDLMGVPLVSIKESPLRGVCAVSKRTFDVVFSGFMLVALSPLLAAIAAAIRLDSPGPVIYEQERIGRHGRPFMCLKFRSMVADAEKDTGPIWAVNGDPRTTRIGSFLRRYSLDELPQLWNILKGEMSLIGPRPERPFFVNNFRKEIPRYMERHKVLPGLTGWAQVNGLRGKTSIVERTKFDLFYIDNWTSYLEVKVFIKTFLEVVMQREAY